ADSQHSSTEQQQATEQTSEPTELKDLPAWAQKQIRDARKDAEKSRLKVKEFEDANKTEAERSATAAKAAEERATAAEQQLRSERAERAVLAAATASYANDPDAILALALPKLDFDDDGRPSNVDAVFAALKKERPERFKASAGTADGGKQTSESRDIKPGLDRLTYAYETQSKTAPRPR
ncbi:MAG: hypothetical protein ACR2OE_09460, partial [Thermomicrobiales bacterium]